MDDRPGKIIHNSADSPEGKLIGAPIQQNKEKATRANPIKYIKKDSPPFLIMHGKKDALVIWEQSQLLHKSLQAEGQSSKLLLFDDLGHGGKGWAENTEYVIEFFNSIFKD